MIVNISGKSSPFQFNRIRLDQFKQYKLRLISLHATFTTKADAGIYKLSTNLIERDDGNLERILAFVRLNRKQITLDFTPTQLVWYKLRLQEFSMSDIKLSSITTEENQIFSEFAIQLEIVRDERI